MGANGASNTVAGLLVVESLWTKAMVGAHPSLGAVAAERDHAAFAQLRAVVVRAVEVKDLDLSGFGFGAGELVLEVKKGFVAGGGRDCGGGEG